MSSRKGHSTINGVFRLYAYIGLELAAKSPEHSHDYSDWIRTYSGSEALEQASKSEALLNLLAPGGDLGILDPQAAPFFLLSLPPVKQMQYCTLLHIKRLKTCMHNFSLTPID